MKTILNSVMNLICIVGTLMDASAQVQQAWVQHPIMNAP